MELRRHFLSRTSTTLHTVQQEHPGSYSPFHYFCYFRLVERLTFFPLSHEHHVHATILQNSWLSWLLSSLS